MEIYRSHVLVCGGTGCTSSGSAKLIDRFNEKLKEYNIYGRRYFYPLISTFSAYKGLESANPSNLPVAHKLADQVLCLPMFADLDDEGVNRVINVIVNRK